MKTLNEQTAKTNYYRYSFIIVAWLFAACVMIQVFTAGLAIFADPINWQKHTVFVHFFQYLPLIMFVLAIFAKLPKAMRWQCIGLFALIFLQYTTANLDSVGMLAAFHTIIALVLFSGSVAIARRASNKQ